MLIVPSITADVSSSVQPALNPLALVSSIVVVPELPPPQLPGPPGCCEPPLEDCSAVVLTVISPSFTVRSCEAWKPSEYAVIFTVPPFTVTYPFPEAVSVSVLLIPSPPLALTVIFKLLKSVSNGSPILTESFPLIPSSAAVTFNVPLLI